jgi:hypothetical protein
MRTLISAAIALAVTACGDADETNQPLINEAAAQVANGPTDQKPETKTNETFNEVDFSDEGGLPGCFNPSLSGRERRVAERLGATPCDTEQSSNVTTQMPEATGFAGYWTGSLDGGNGYARIFPSENAGGYDVELDMAGGGSGCSGSLVGNASSSGNRLVVRQAIPDGSGQCTVTFTRNGSALSVAENRCSYFHGASCEFNGTLQFQQAEDPLEPDL